MIQITADQIERVNLILSGVPKGAEKAMASVIRRANNTVRSEALSMQTRSWYGRSQRLSPDFWRSRRRGWWQNWRSLT